MWLNRVNICVKMLNYALFGFVGLRPAPRLRLLPVPHAPDRPNAQ
jgi:hypothetical protein